MASRTGRGDRGNRKDGRKARAGAGKAARPGAKRAAERKYYEHPRYGRIPLVPMSRTAESGVIETYYKYDLDWQPPLPPGAVRGDPHKQDFCPMCHQPRYFYVEESRKCVQCGNDFVFTGSEQKYWYETLKFHFDSKAIRCIDCRRKKRSERTLQQHLADVKRAMRERPDEPEKQLELARAIVALRASTGHGDLAEAISSARQAQKSSALATAARLVEAQCQNLAGRTARAAALYARVIGEPGGNKDGDTQRKIAERRLNELNSVAQ